MDIQLRSDLSVEIKPLSARESMLADGIVGGIMGDAPANGSMAFLISKVYSVAAIRAMNGVPVTPLAGGAAFSAVCDRLSLTDLMKLMDEYSKLDAVDLGAVKNESSAVASEA